MKKKQQAVSWIQIFHLSRREKKEYKNHNQVSVCLLLGFNQLENGGRQVICNFFFLEEGKFRRMQAWIEEHKILSRCNGDKSFVKAERPFIEGKTICGGSKSSHFGGQVSLLKRATPHVEEDKAPFEEGNPPWWGGQNPLLRWSRPHVEREQDPTFWGTRPNVEGNKTPD